MQIYSWSNYPGDATHCHRLYAGLVYISHSKPESYVTYSRYLHSIGSRRFPGSGSYYGHPSTNTTDACYNFESKTSEKGFKIKHRFIPMNFLLLESVFDKILTAKKSVDMI